MLLPLVSWMFSSPSSSSTSSDGEDNLTTKDGDYEYDVNGSQEDDCFLGQTVETPQASCAGVALAVLDSSPAVAFRCAGTDTGTNTRGKQQRINCSGSGTGRQYQRLWTKQDEIELLKGYLHYIRQNGWTTSSLQHDVAFFYDQTRPKLNVDFNKNQLVEKLRRLKRKHKTVLDQIKSGKDITLKSPQDRAIFKFSQKIWGKSKSRDEDALDDDESIPSPETYGFGNDIKEKSEEVEDDEVEKMKKPTKRLRTSNEGSFLSNNSNSHIQGLVEKTMRSCFPALMNELLNNGEVGGEGPQSSELMEGLAVNPTRSGNGEVGDEKCRRQRIMTLEVYLKRLELLQDQMKARLEELRSGGE